MTARWLGMEPPCSLGVMKVPGERVYLKTLGFAGGGGFRGPRGYLGRYQP